MIPLTYAVTLADWTPQQDMLRMMLRCLGDQTCQDFDVILADHHYDARKSSVDELSKNYKFKIHHIPIIPAPHVAKHYIDCSVFNVGWILSDAERCIRYSEWRFLDPKLTETILDEPKELFLDFYFHNIQETPKLWNRETGLIKWEEVPLFNDPDTDIEQIPLNCYANNTTSREQWAKVNGFNEVDFNFFHWEDIDYNARCRNSGFRGKRLSNMMFRIDHPYGLEPNRANRPCEKPFKQPCDSCEDLIHYVRYHIGTPTHKEWGSIFAARHSQVSIVERGFKKWAICNKCNFIIPILDTEDLAEYILRDGNYTKSPINVNGSGRNLQTLIDDLKGKSMATKLQIYEDSWTNERYLTLS